MRPYFFVAIIIVVAVAVVIGIPARASRKGVCFREWMKAFAPVATLVAACFAAFAVIAAWQNLTETGKGSLVRVDEILRHRLIAIEKETDGFNAIASKSVDLTNLYKTLHDLQRT